MINEKIAEFLLQDNDHLAKLIDDYPVNIPVSCAAECKRLIIYHQ